MPTCNYYKQRVTNGDTCTAADAALTSMTYLMEEAKNQHSLFSLHKSVFNDVSLSTEFHLS